jgi:branched-chain amino acid transport system substrate-binding protein
VALHGGSPRRYGRRGGRSALAGVALVALVMTGCGSTSARPVSAAAGSVCPGTPGVTASAVKLGVLYPNTGRPSGLFSSYRAGVDARLGVANAAGGVYGRTVGYNWVDDRGDTAGNLAGARQLITQDQDFGLLEETTVAGGSAKWLNQQGIPVVGTSAGNVWNLYRNMFGFANYITPGPSPTSWGTYVRAHGGTRAAVFYQSFDESSTLFREKFITSLRAAGVQVADVIDIEPTSYDANAIARRLAAEHVDAIVGATDPTSFVTIAAVAKASGVGLKTVLTPTGYAPQVVTQAGSILKGVFSVFLDSAPFEENLPVDQTFLRAMATYAPQIQPSDDSVALEGWMNTDLLLTGLRAAGKCPTRAGFITGLRKVTGYTADGLVPEPMDMAADFGKPNRCYTFVEINGAGTGWAITSKIPSCSGLTSG